ncbi:putative alpha-ketoglutarate-dependent sulfonate dioxygenase [Lachnellula occidentalis]|uniref:Putative alpha-ketoglutarate-dependent sulfonate dioxygenase n=1 Tax=Lachnellula occidentalis TaxID=215460 RepID=A0A8H8RRH6_9HELO|nr:putative alpha-ketoglutarate-dependent sulfonate dioxygenase [Lachnellula occidentalis]
MTSATIDPHVEYKMTTNGLTNGIDIVALKAAARAQVHFELESSLPTPLELTRSLKAYPTSDLTPAIGTTFEKIDIHAILNSPECDAKIRDLAIIIARRGVCVFPNQADLTIEDQKTLCHKLGRLTCRPYSSGLNIHPLNQSTMPDGSVDPALATLTRDPSKKLVKQAGFGFRFAKQKQSGADGWHTDCSYENVPADFTLLHMKTTPVTGGDTLFASAYEMYDLLSTPYAKFLEGLNATFTPPGHTPENIVDRMWKGPRGSPENVGPELCASHTIIRTNPVTGWKALYGTGHHMEGVDGLAQEESDMIKHHLERLITDNHQLQVRVKWAPDTLVVWDNRSCYHTATFDYTDERSANRICGCGEKPYLDVRSSSRRYALGLKK